MVCFWREHNKFVTVEKVVFVRYSGNFATVEKDGGVRTRVLLKNLRPISQMENLVGFAQEINQSSPVTRAARSDIDPPPVLAPMAILKNKITKAEYGKVLIPEFHYRLEAKIAEVFVERGSILFTHEHYENFGLSPEFRIAIGSLESRGLPVSTIGWASQRLALLIQREEIPESELGIVVNYKDYYNTEWWCVLRGFVIEFYGGNCSFCGSTESLHVHHKTYKNIGAELPEDLSVLCESCHSAHHKLKKGGDVYDLAVQFIDVLEKLKKAV